MAKRRKRKTDGTAATTAATAAGGDAGGDGIERERLEALAASGDVWLRLDGSVFDGVVIPSLPEEPWPEGLAAGLTTNDPAWRITGFDLDQLGVWQAGIGRRETAAAGDEDRVAFVLTALVAPGHLLRARQAALATLDADRYWQTQPASHRLERAMVAARRGLQAEAAAALEAWRERDPQRLGTRPERVADASLFANGMPHDGSIRQIGERPYAVLPGADELPQDRRLRPLFTPFEIGVVRRGYGITERVASARRIQWSVRVLERRAAGERLRHDRPALVDFLERYRGDSPFLGKMRNLVANGAPLSAAQLEAVERAYAGIMRKETTAQDALRRRTLERTAAEPKKPAELEWIRREAVVVACTRTERPDPFRPGTTIVRHRLLLRTDDGAILLAKASAFQAGRGERVRLMAAREGVETDPQTGAEMTVINRLFPLDADGKVIRRPRPRRAVHAMNPPASAAGVGPEPAPGS